MKILCNKKEFFESILLTLKCISHKSSDPILEGILIIAKEKYLILQSYNLEISISIVLNNIQINKSGSAIFNARLLRNIISKFNNDDNIEINVEKGIAVFICNKSKFEISVLLSEDFPTLPLISQKNNFFIESYKLKSLISHTIFAVSQSESKLIHTGCLFDINNNFVKCIALDGYRIAIKNEKIDLNENIKFVVPSNALKEILYIIDDSNDLVEININEKNIMLIFKNITFTSRLLSGNFLDYRNALKNNIYQEFIINRKSFIESIIKVSLIITERNKQAIKLIFNNSILFLKCTTSLGTSYDEINITHNNNKELSNNIIKIGCNHKYLLDALKSIDDENIILKISDEISPIIILPCFNNEDLHIILPVRLEEDN